MLSYINLISRSPSITVIKVITFFLFYGYDCVKFDESLVYDN